MPDPFLGRTIKGYRVSEVLGEGGMGRVYKAEHQKIGKTVAIKVLLKDGAQNPTLLQRFFTEAKAVNDIRHENVVDILDLDETPEGEHFLLMEYLEGCTLSSAIQSEGPFSTERVAAIGIQLCSALHAAHRAGIIHRDLKGDNIFLTKRGDTKDFVKVLDFGIAKLTYGNASMTTKTGAVVGTPLTMSPEQARGEPVDALSDIYALGVILHQMATKAPPFFDENPFIIVGMHMNAPLKPLKERNPNINPLLASVISRCLEKDKAARFSSMKELALALANAASLDPKPIEQWSEVKTSAPESTTPTPREPPTKVLPIEKTTPLPPEKKSKSELSDVTGEALKTYARPLHKRILAPVLTAVVAAGLTGYLVSRERKPDALPKPPAPPKPALVIPAKVEPPLPPVPPTPPASLATSIPASVPAAEPATSAPVSLPASTPASHEPKSKPTKPTKKTISFDIDPFKQP